jgi:hypothetical protein
MGKRMFEQEEEEEKYEKDEAAEDEGLEFFRLLLVFIMMPFISYTGIFFLLCSFLFSFIFLANRFHQKERDTQSRFRHRHHKPKSEKGPTAATVVAIHPSSSSCFLFFKVQSFCFEKPSDEEKKNRERECVFAAPGLRCIGCRGPPRSIPS